jgi:ribosomal protein L9
LKNLKHITIEATTTPMGNFYHKIEKKDIIELLFKHVHYKFATKSISGDFPFGQLGNFAIKIKEQGREATVQCTIIAKK